MSAGSHRSTLRERRKQETHDQIRRVALELVQERGYEAVTVDLISERAGVSVRTFFNYFANKESAMLAIPPPLSPSSIQDFLSGGGRHDLYADLADLAMSQLEVGDVNPSSFEASMQIVLAVPELAKVQFAVFVELEAQFTGLIAARLGVDPDEAEPAVIAAAFMATMRVAGLRWSRSMPQHSLGDEVRMCLRNLSMS